MTLIPCKHLDYNKAKYNKAAELCSGDEKGFTGFRYWRRRIELDHVQFCGQGRGRINDCFACYEPGTMPCYEAE